MVLDDDFASRFGIADYAVFVMMLCISSGIGLYYGCSGNRQRTASEFLTANRSMGLIPITLSLLATFLSSLTLLGIPTEIYIYGTSYILWCLCFLIAVPIGAYCYVPVFYDLGLTSVNEYLEKRFNSTVRKCTSLIAMVQTLLYMSIVLYAPALAINQATGISTWGSVATTGIVCIVYSTIGGIKGIMWTDVLQVCVIWISIITVSALGTTRLNGIGNVWQTANKGGRLDTFNFDPSPFTRHTVWSVVLGGTVNILFAYGVSQTQVQRYLSSPSLRNAQISALMNIPTSVFHQVLCAFIGLLIFAEYSSCDPLTAKHILSPNQLLPLYVMDVVGGLPGLPGLFVAGIFSAALSSLSSGLNSLAANTLEDFVKISCLKNLSAEKAGLISKILGFSFGIVVMALVAVTSQFGGFMQVAITIFGIAGGPVVGIFTLGLFFPWANSKGALAGLTTGLGFISWIAIGAQITKPFVPKLGVSVKGCNFTDVVYNITIPQEKEVFPLYKISYLWYSVIALGTTLAVGLIVSFVTGHQNPRELDAGLLSPVVRNLIKGRRSLLKCSYKEPVAGSIQATHHELGTTKL